MSRQETFGPAFANQEKPMLSYGIPFTESCNKHVTALNASRVYIIASGSLARTTNLLKKLLDTLGSKVVGMRVGIASHTLFSDCLQMLREVIDLNVDCIVTLGGGSLSDAAKIISFAEANNATTREKLLALPHMMNKVTECNSSRLPVILIPSTLSGAEYTQFAGVTDDQTKIKYQFSGKLQRVNIVILSEEVALTTPLPNWIASGVRAVDHCVECLCCLITEPQDVARVHQASLEGLRILLPGLLGTVRDPQNPEARLKCHLGVVHSVTHLCYSSRPGASHGIGHILGPMGVQHGMTSCILMTSVQKYNASATVSQQKILRDTMWGIPEGRKLFNTSGLHEDTADLGDLLDALVRALKMPRTLTEVGITGDDQLWTLARNSLEDPCMHYNPIPISSPDEVFKILQTCR